MQSAVGKWIAAFVTLLLALASIPQIALAFPFGGPITQIIFCYNGGARYVAVGPPRGGPYIWTPETKTYQFGPPSHVGQYLLGLAAPPYFCLVSREPIIVWSGILITMMGSSGPASPRYNPPPSNTGPGLPSPPPPPPPGPPGPPPLPSNPTMGHVAISEVYYSVDSAHGTDPTNEWVEIYNGTSASVNISGWTIADSATARTVPNGFSIPPNSFAVIAAAASTKTLWAIPSAVPFIDLGNLIGNGLNPGGDDIFLRDATGNIVDSLSWGTDTRVYNPPIPSIATGHALVRKQLSTDNQSSTDWIEVSTPTPGR